MNCARIFTLLVLFFLQCHGFGVYGMSSLTNLQKNRFRTKYNLKSETHLATKLKMCFKSEDCNPEYCCEMVQNLIYMCCDNPLKTKEFIIWKKMGLEPIPIPTDT